MNRKQFCENCGWEYTLDHLANWTGMCDKCGYYNREDANEFLKKKAVEKLNAWRRLKDKGFEFEGRFKDNTINYDFVKRPLNYDENEEAEQDLAFLFGGEE